MTNNKKKTREELKKLEQDLIRKQTDLAAFLAEKEDLESALETELEQELREEARRNFKAFVVQAWDQIEPGKEFSNNWHVDAICDHLEAVVHGHIQNLIIAIPPRCSKSTISSVCFPTWAWLQDPTERFITVAAVEKLVVRDAVRSRRLLQSPWYQKFNPPFELQKDVNQKSRYENTASGYRIAVSVGSSAIGEGYTTLICLPFEEEIDTNLGRLRIGEIVEKEIKCKVKTFNHDTNKVEWLTIDRYEKNPRGNRAIYEVETASGIKFRATEDHPIYNVGEGCYTNVVDLKVGESVYVSMQSLPEGNAKEKELLLQRLSNIGCRSLSSIRSSLQLLSNKIQENEQGHKAFFNSFLQSYLPRKVSERIQNISGESSIYLSNLFKRKTSNTKQEQRVLFPKMFWLVNKKGRRTPLSRVWSGISPESRCDKTMFQEMPSTVPLETNEGEKQQQLQTRGVYEYCSPQRFVPERLQFKAEKENSGKVQQFLSNLQEKCKGFTRTPYRFQQGKFFRGKFDSFVQVLSRNFTRKAYRLAEKCGDFTDVITRISRTEDQPEYVYNIATGNHNYFCRGVLIHNCDDLTKPSDVKSKAEMENILDFYLNTLSTRKNSADARRILIQQRLATNDPIGYELANNEELWDVLMLPMEYDSSMKKYITNIGWTDPRKKDGECLWPERFPPAELKNLKKQLGVYGTAAQLQQNPVPLEGGIIKRDWIVKNHYNSQDQFNRFSLNQFDLIIGSWDLTFSNTGDSWNVGIVVGKKGSDKYVLDMWRGRYDIIQQRDAIREMYAKYPQIRAMLIEKKANGEAVQRVLRREIPGILLIDPRDIGAGDKEARLSACAIDFEANNVKFPHPSLPGCSWVELAIDELTLFPKTPNDDIVDAVSMALNWLASKSNNKMTVAASNFLSNNNPQEKAKFEGKVAPSKEDLNQDGSFLQIIEQQVTIPTFNVSGLKSYKSIFN